MMPSRLQAALRDVDDLRRRVKDPLVRAQNANALLAEHQAVVNQLASVRREAVRELRAARWSFSEIGEALGVSKSMAAKIAGGTIKDVMSDDLRQRTQGRLEFTRF